MSRPAVPDAANSRPLRDPFADRASLLCRTLLTSPGLEWTVRGLAESAGVAPMLSSDVIRQLSAAAIVTTRPEGRKLLVRLTNAQKLLEAWTARYSWSRNAELAVSIPIPDDDRFLGRVGKVLGRRRWALTLLSGAWRRIQYTPTDRFHIYVECDSIAELRTMAEGEGWSADSAGRVVLMKPAYRTSVWHGMAATTDGEAPVVSDLQLILDLWHYPVRGRETAEQLWRPIARRFERQSSANGDLNE